MIHLGKLIFVLLATQTSPGRSIYSFEPAPDCGTDPSSAECSLERACDEALYREGWSESQRKHFASESPLCIAPRYSKARGGWVRIERRATALARYARIADVLSRTASRLVHCHDGGGVVDESCVREQWPGAATTFALSGLTVVIHESGGREDIQEGHPPVGIGSGGEVGLMQLMPEYTPALASWLDEDERKTLLDAEPSKRIAWARSNLLGQKNLSKHIEIGLRALARARRSCAGKKLDWRYGMFSMYASGSSCSAGDVANHRVSTYVKLEGFNRSHALRVAWPALAKEAGIACEAGQSDSAKCT